MNDVRPPGDVKGSLATLVHGTVFTHHQHNHVPIKSRIGLLTFFFMRYEIVFDILDLSSHRQENNGIPSGATESDCGSGDTRR